MGGEGGMQQLLQDKFKVGRHPLGGGEGQGHGEPWERVLQDSAKDPGPRRTGGHVWTTRVQGRAARAMVRSRHWVCTG